MITAALERKIFLALLLVVTIAFLAILLPFYGAVFWGMILAILFHPLNRRFVRKMKGRENPAALSTLGVVLLLVILPVALIATSLVREATAIYQRIGSGQFNLGTYFQRIIDVLPNWAVDLLNRFGLGDLEAMQNTVSSAAARGSQLIATQALSIGQNTLEFVVSFGVMLYLLYFLLRDGSRLSNLIIEAIPLAPEHKRRLMAKFTTVVRATVKGNIVVAAVQGALGGLIFWILGVEGVVLWSVVMAFLSLLPAVGAGLIWGPVAIYFLATGKLVQGAVLIAYGILVIGLVDNVLRPLLVGKDTKMPDYVVLISTLGGMALFGINGFVIGPVIAALFMSAWALFMARDEDAVDEDEGDTQRMGGGDTQQDTVVLLPDEPAAVVVATPPAGPPQPPAR